MLLTTIEYKDRSNQYYSNNESLLTIESYDNVIKHVKNNSGENIPFYLLYLNQLAAYIQDKNCYYGHQDAKQSLKFLKKGEF
jgi:hypothetical protein